MILDLFKENWAIEVNNSALPPSATKALSHFVLNSPDSNIPIYFLFSFSHLPKLVAHLNVTVQNRALLVSRLQVPQNFLRQVST